MAMKRLKLKGNGLTRRTKPRTAAERKKALVEARKNRAARKLASKQYYRKNKSEILKRAKVRRSRKAKGDLRVTRKRSKVGAPVKIKLGDR
ncbi:hypothetical protein Aura_00142 [Pseudomonas phage vB_PpuM-Aura]